MDDAAVLASLDGWKCLNALDSLSKTTPFMNPLPFAAREAVFHVLMAMQETPFPDHPVVAASVFEALGCAVAHDVPVQRGLNCLAKCPDNQQLATDALCAIAVSAGPERGAVRLPQDTDVLRAVLRRVGSKGIRYWLNSTECIAIWLTPDAATGAHELQQYIHDCCTGVVQEFS